MKIASLILISISLAQTCFGQSQGEVWPRFRGPNGSGVAAENAKPPITFSEKNLRWKIELPEGVSSPVVWNDKLFLTGYIDSSKELQTICVSGKNGKILWKTSVFPDTIEKCCPLSSPAQSSVTTDGERVIVFFGSCGFICYDMQGKLMWKHPMKCATFKYGNATSPVIEGTKVLLSREDGKDRYLIALDKRDGSQVWRSNYRLPSTFGQYGAATPCIYKNMAIVHYSGAVASYSVDNGSLQWEHGTVTEASSSPVVADNKVLVNCWFNVSDEAERPEIPAYDDMLMKYDVDKNGSIGKIEIPENLMVYHRPELKDLSNVSTSSTIKNMFGTFDKNKDGGITRNEWDSTFVWLKANFYKPSGFIAIDAESKGSVNDNQILWRITKKISEVPSPIFYLGRAYMAKEGGFITCVNPETGIVLYQIRDVSLGPIFASPIAANGYLYIFGYNGMLKVIKAGDKFEIAGEYNFKDQILATPAITGNTIFIRTKTGLLAYSN
jgi:outer membrane protein assembly factor BamB